MTSSAPGRRRESAYALARRRVTLADLKLVDLLRTGDALHFAYRERTFTAHVARDGCLVGESAATHYDRPSNWTLACVQRYWGPGPRTCKTVPPGFERVTVARLGCTLAQLREHFMRDPQQAIDTLHLGVRAHPVPSRKRAREQSPLPAPAATRRVDDVPAAIERALLQ